MTPKVITAAASEPLTIAECRLHLRIDPDLNSDDEETHPDDTLILALLGAAREHCENFTGLSLAQRTLEVALDEFPEDEVIELPGGPVVSISSVSVGEESDAELEAADYVLDNYSTPSRILPATTWPTVTASTNTVKIRYVAGFGDGTDDTPLPYALRAAMLLVLGHLYERREDATEKALSSLPLGAEVLMRPYRVRLGMA
jgi:uncharacterized phiE125 gp8 family phage protein